jgi:hypothetical protein
MSSAEGQVSSPSRHSLKALHTLTVLATGVLVIGIFTSTSHFARTTSIAAYKRINPVSIMYLSTGLRQATHRSGDVEIERITKLKVEVLRRRDFASLPVLLEVVDIEVTRQGEIQLSRGWGRTTTSG